MVRTTVLISLIFSLTLSVVAQTIPAPNILCVATDEQTGDVDISWDQPSLDPCGPFIEYVLLGSTDPNGPFTVVGTISAYGTLTFAHTGASGTVVDWYYKIYMRQNCPGFTSDTSAVGIEQTLFTPGIEYVTVLPNGTVQINWEPSPNTAPDGFAILTIDPATGLGQRIDSVLGSSSVTYNDNTSDPTSGSVTYDVKAFDFCTNETGINPTHNTIYLTSDINTCDQKVTLDFNPYVNWPGDTVEDYEVTVEVDGSTFEVVSLGNNFPATPGIRYSYVYDIEPLQGDSVVFTVTAVHPNGNFRSSSNIVGMPLNALRSTAYNYIKNVTVMPDNTVELTWIVDTAADLSRFVVKRGLDTASMEAIDTIPVNLGAINFEETYEDQTVDASSGPYFYQVETLDTCGFILESEFAKTILLTGILNENTGNSELDWTEYEQAEITLINNTLYRYIEDDNTAITTVVPEIRTYEDPVYNAVTTQGEFCYIVETEYQLVLRDLRLQENLRSFSNLVCLELPPIVWIPNAFVPNGNNQFFKPVLLFDVNEYEFRIFDRWGKELFGTESIIAGWDGTYNGTKMPTGGYVYHVKAVTTAGDVFEKQGVVALIR